MTAEEILKAMEEMDNGERILLLKALSEKHFGGSPSQAEITRLYSKFWEDEDEA